MRRALAVLAQLPPVVLTGMMVAWLVGIWSTRIDFPFDLEWMEGGMLVHVWRLEQGLGLYVPPSADFVPYIYPPLYPWLLHLLGEPSYAIGRGVSVFGAALACAAAVFAVRREGVPWGIAVGAAGLFLSCYEDSGTFYDIVRADALAIGIAAWSIALCRQATRPYVIGGGLLLVVAWLTKHNYALFGLPIGLWLWGAHGWRRAALFAAASAVPAGLITLAMNVATDGYFLTYLLGVPGSHPLVAERAWPLAEKELATVLQWTSGAMVLLALTFILRVRAAGLYWLGILATAVGACILMRAHHGGFVNVMMPGHWALAVCGAAMLGAAAQRWSHPVVVLLLSSLMAWQIHDGRWEPRAEERMKPTPEEVEAGYRLIDQIAAYEGEVLAPQFAWYPAMAGKTPSLPLIAQWDIDHKGGPLKREADALPRSIAEQRWPVILTAHKHIKYGIEQHYTKTTRVTARVGVSTRTGWRVRPTWFWEPTPPAAPEPAAPNPPAPDATPAR
ncbi:MAG: hypothetical protein H6739_15380 [Alphaproteobacteria bacterium]|nr:hypothetical protein [Alphaproteobacteria bacterium]